MSETSHLLYGVGAIVAIGLVVFLMLFVKRRASAGEHPQRRQKNEVAASQITVREDAALSDSGAFAIDELVDLLVKSGDHDLAEKWASNALRSQPDHVEVAVKLAGIYHQRNKRNEFFAILNEHIIKSHMTLSTEL